MEEMNDYEDDFEVEESSSRDQVEIVPKLHQEEMKEDEEEPRSNEVYMWGDDSRG